jgi:hypothetical protein
MWNRGLGYAWRVGVVGLLFGLVAGCAEGMPGPDSMVAGFIGTPPPVGGSAAPVSDGGMAGRGSDGLPPPLFSGEACEQGDTEACTCADGVSAGMKVCRFERTSPTMGAFSMCEGCEAPTTPPEGGSDGGGSGAGSGASGSGSGGAGSGASGSGSGGAGSGAAGTMGGSGASGSGSSGTGGSSGGAGRPAPGCDPDDCDEPLLGSACCTDDDECGVRLLLSCNAR